MMRKAWAFCHSYIPWAAGVLRCTLGSDWLTDPGQLYLIDNTLIGPDIQDAEKLGIQEARKAGSLKIKKPANSLDEGDDGDVNGGSNRRKASILAAHLRCGTNTNLALGGFRDSF